MITFRDDASQRRLTIKKVLYHPLTLAALGLHAALILAPVSRNGLPLPVKVGISLAICLGCTVLLVRSGIFSQPDKFKKILFHPLTWIALWLHALLLTVPFSTSNPPVKAAEVAKEPDAMPVDLLNLSEIATSTPPPASETPPQPPPQALPPTAAPPTAPPPTAAPDPPPLPADPVASTPLAEPTPAPANVPVPVPKDTPPPATPTPAYDPAQDQQVFIENLSAMSLKNFTGTVGLPPADLFRSPENSGYFVSGGAPVAGAASANWLDKEPGDVLNELTASYASAGIVFNQLDNYGGEVLYEVVTPQGNPFMYVSLAQLKGSSLMVVWSSNPLR